jgi:hypothetical protein
MYDINFNTCTALDVIKRSNVCHPSLLADGLQEVRRKHLEYANLTPRDDAARIARDMADECNIAMMALADDDYETVMATISRRVIVFDVAASLQLVPRPLRGEIVTRD